MKPNEPSNMTPVNSHAIRRTLDRILSVRPKRGSRNRTLQVDRELLVEVCALLVNSALPKCQALASLRHKLRGRCPGKTAFYNFTIDFLRIYGEEVAAMPLGSANAKQAVKMSDRPMLAPHLMALTLEEVAFRLSLDTHDVSLLIKEGRLRGIDLMGNVRVPVESIRSLLDGSSQAR